MTVSPIRPIAGRDPYAGQWVAVYRNLSRGAWSIRAQDGPHKGKVVGHAECVGIVDCTMHVGKAAQRRIANGSAREVHAWIIGRLAPVTLDAPRRLTYRPHERGEFYLADTGAALWRADAVLFTDAAYVSGVGDAAPGV